MLIRLLHCGVQGLDVGYERKAAELGSDMKQT